MGLKEQLIAILEKAGYLSQYPGTLARILMENGVEIPVRCKDCKFYHTMEEGFKDCINVFGIDVPQNYDFCSYGERKADD